MIDPRDTAALQDRLDQLEARAMRATGAEHAGAHLNLLSRGKVQFRAHAFGRAEDAYTCAVYLGPVRGPDGKPSYPASIEATGPDPLAAIESAFSQLHQRERAALEPAPTGDEFDAPREPVTAGGV